MLVKHPDDLMPTEVPDNVLEGLQSSLVTDVHVFGRRGPMQVKFTPLELRELGELRDVDIILHDEDFVLDDASKRAIESNKQIFVINKVFDQWRERQTGSASRRLHLHFYASPLEVLGDSHVTGFRYERTEPDGAGGVRGTGEIREITVQALYRAVGYFGSALPGVPFDQRQGIIPNHEGQVIDDDNRIVPGVYATGWIKRGPVGLIGHTKSDAMETVQHLVKDQASWWSPEAPDEASVLELMESRGIRFTNLDGWHKLDAKELELGSARGRERLKVVPREEMLETSLAEAH
jgi:ferredoxin--NADP+ reductase